ncbi:MAG: 4-(cytidine 5'-diphospho)-2-C-methyl-D-erythritol kinase, partial [Burkholderiales bacterium]
MSAEAGAARLVVSAPAKVNLFLHVTGRRADGYHTLESLFVLIDWSDTLTLEARDDGAIVRTQPLPGVDDRDDLAVRAAQALRDATGVTRGVTIAVDKRIPMGAGLGGGSADAAGVLLALNRLWQLGLPRPALAEIGGRLGADVPFFVGGETALARGTGDLLTPVSMPTLWLALAVPKVRVSTAEIFS